MHALAPKNSESKYRADLANSQAPQNYETQGKHLAKFSTVEHSLITILHPKLR